jgi:uncharacterized membrane protein
MTGSHHHDADVQPSSPRVRRAVAVTAAALAVTAIALVVVFWPDGAPDRGIYQPFATALYDAEVTGAVDVECPGDPAAAQPAAAVRCQQLELTLEEGPDEGETTELNYVQVPGSAPLALGDDIVVGHSPDAPPEFQYYFADFQRDTPLRVLFIVFVVAVLLLGRWGGLRALIGAGASLAVIVTFLIPGLVEGTSPVTMALVASGVIAVLALYLTHGISHRTNVAFLGTVASLGLTALLAAAFVAATHLTGLADEDATYLQLGSTPIDVTGLLLAGIVIGALGVLDDVTVTQVSAVWELHAADSTATARQVYHRAITIGRDHIASTVNTLVLAYVGASLPLLLLFEQGDQPLGRVLAGEAIATEVVRALVGSIGLVASVPITTALAVAVVGAPRSARDEVEEEAQDPSGAADPVDLPVAAEPPPRSAAWSDFSPEERDF